MARGRSKERETAFELYKEHEGKIQNRELARILGLPERTIGGWKCKDKWDEQLCGVPPENDRSTDTLIRLGPSEGDQEILHCDPEGEEEDIPSVADPPAPRSRGAPPGNQNALGNRGGHGAPEGNDRAAKHGLYRQFLPQDKEYQELLDAVEQMDPVDMLWDNITIKYASIIRAQKIMYVSDKNDETKVLTKISDTMNEYEYQHAWDKYSNFLAAQSRAMSELRSLIKDFLVMSGKDDERRLKLEHMQAVIDKTKVETGRLEKGGDAPKQLEIFIDYG